MYVAGTDYESVHMTGSGIAAITGDYGLRRRHLTLTGLPSISASRALLTETKYLQAA